MLRLGAKGCCGVSWRLDTQLSAALLLPRQQGERERLKGSELGTSSSGVLARVEMWLHSGARHWPGSLPLSTVVLLGMNTLQFAARARGRSPAPFAAVQTQGEGTEHPESPQ